MVNGPFIDGAIFAFEKILEEIDEWLKIV
jgi:hypothetical protein